ncbi:MAG: DNA recombination protein RmuC [Desulfobulbus propionicus]|nr:MAG: DNA recombination protein RmuC [Desulfobulbus propionicus]
MLTIILAFILLSRQQKKLLIAKLRLEQTETAAREQAALTEKVHRENAALQAKCAAMDRQLKERDIFLEASRRQIEQRFEVLAGEILSEKGSLINQHHESSLNLLLQPFKDQLQEFKQRVDAIYDQESRDRQAIILEVQQLKKLNEQLRSDAVNLTEALQGKVKLQGQWGEMLLERILEESGLRKGKEYTTQETLYTEKGQRRQPDVIIRLPEDRHLIVDAKVSLKAFTLAYAEKNNEKRNFYIRKHLASVKKHINILSEKRYHRLCGITTLDFVFLFIPVEAAFQMAVHHEPTLLTHALGKQIILCCPSTLLATLRTVHTLWKRAEQNQNGLRIAKQAGNIYDKLVGFVESFEEVGIRLNQSQQAWQLARKRLATGRGNVLTSAEHLKELGVQSDKELTTVIKHEP